MRAFILTITVGLFACLSASAQVQIDKPIQMTGASSSDRQIKNLGEATNSADAVSAGEVQGGSLNYAVASGAANAFEVTLTPVPVAYTPGMTVNFKANSTITGSTTLSINGLGPKYIRKLVTAELGASDILAGQLVSVIYDGTSFQLLSPSTDSTPTIINDKSTTAYYSSAGTWTAPTGITEIILEIWGSSGGGGGGANGGTSGGCAAYGGYAGGAGGYTKRKLKVVPGQSYNIIIGAGGARGAGASGSPYQGIRDGHPGAAGGPTQFDEIIIPGGTGGAGGENQCYIVPGYRGPGVAGPVDQIFNSGTGAGLISTSTHPFLNGYGIPDRNEGGKGGSAGSTTGSAGSAGKSGLILIHY